MTASENNLLSVAVRTEIDHWLRKFPQDQKRSAILYALRIVQEENGWLTEALMNAVADYLQQPQIAVYEVATFYSMYDLKPCGQHKIGICTNISCMLCGSKQVGEYLQKRLGIGFNQTTADGKFSLRAVECLAACAGAPALIVDDKHYHEKVTPESIDKILESLE
jgi:NADH-quinone oxidoreductase subunit E